jgi:hypothetical protein
MELVSFKVRMEQTWKYKPFMARFFLLFLILIRNTTLSVFSLVSPPPPPFFFCILMETLYRRPQTFRTSNSNYQEYQYGDHANCLTLGTAVLCKLFDVFCFAVLYAHFFITITIYQI